MEERMREILDSWYGRLDDLVADLKDAGYSVEEANREYVSGWDDKSMDKDIFYTIKLGGTERTITIDDIRIEEMED